MEIEEIDISSIEPYEFNNRKHPAEQVERIAKSIKDFGFNQPILIDPSNMTVIAGHGRLLAAKSLGLSKVPCCYPSKELSEKEVKALRILDNKLQNDSTWDFDNVGLELDWLEDNAFDLEAWGLDDLRLEIPEEEKEVEDDEFEETEQIEIYIKEGDLIELGPHRVLCGDSTDAAQVAELMDGKEVGCVVTDPPYGIGKLMQGGTWAKKNDAQFEMMRDWDDTTSQEFFDLIAKFGVPSVVWGGNYFETPPSRCWLVWDKPEFPTMSSAELAWTNLDQNTKRLECNRAHQADGKKDHATQKPVKVMAWSLSFVDGLCLDPFIGSGTTIIAADQLKRICYGIEKEPKYCQVIIDRWVKHCEKQEKPANIRINGEPFEWQDQKRS